MLADDAHYFAAAKITEPFVRTRCAMLESQRHRQHIEKILLKRARASGAGRDTG